MTEQESKQILERLLSTKDVLVGNEYTAVSVAISALNKVISSKAKENSKTSTVMSSKLYSVPKEKLLRRLEEIEGELSDWHISAHKCTILYEEKADIEKELAHRNISIENSSKQSKASSKPSEPSYEVVYSDYDDIGLAIEVNGYFPKKVLCRFGFTINGDLEEYGGIDLIDWHHTNIFLTKEEWKHISYKKSPDLILQELNINTEKTYSQSMTK